MYNSIILVFVVLFSIYFIKFFVSYITCALFFLHFLFNYL